LAWDRFRERFPGASDDERFCRMLIDRVAGLAGSNRAVVARLEADLEEQLRRGPLRLPE
jgi:hypothetical protein